MTTKSMEKTNKDKDILLEIVKSIIGNPDSAKIERRVDEMGVLLSVRVSAEDMRLVIGRKGAMIEAIRTVMRAVGLNNNSRINVKVEEPEMQ